MSDLTCDVLVVGSGPGGAVTAMLLAEAGVDVILAEEGASVGINLSKPYSLQEMGSKYRHAGMTVALGNPKMNYVEGCCVGGASEINAGLYNEPSPETIDAWGKAFRISTLEAKTLMPFLKENERLLKVTAMKEGLGPGSRILKRGAAHLSWSGAEVPRAWNYGENTLEGTRNPMSTTVIPRAIKAGCRLVSSVRIERLEHAGGDARYAWMQDGRKIFFKTVFVCGGAIQTPFLLLKSGIKRNIGFSLQAHPAIRTVARFDQLASDEAEGVPVFQITEFKPQLTLGGSFSALPHLALWLAGNQHFAAKIADFKRMGIFYALVMVEGRGSVRCLPGLNEPLVNFNLTDQDLKNLGEGLYKLGQVLFAAGALEIYSPLQAEESFSKIDQMLALQKGLDRRRLDVSTIHLFSSCPMGELPSSAVDSWGRLHGFRNIYINDASMLPSSPGVNPQAVIMGMARRNVAAFLHR